jgi:hypothetical protein
MRRRRDRRAIPSSGPTPFALSVAPGASAAGAESKGHPELGPCSVRPERSSRRDSGGNGVEGPPELGPYSVRRAQLPMRQRRERSRRAAPPSLGPAPFALSVAPDALAAGAESKGRLVPAHARCQPRQAARSDEVGEPPSRRPGHASTWQPLREGWPAGRRTSGPRLRRSFHVRALRRSVAALAISLRGTRIEDGPSLRPVRPDARPCTFSDPRPARPGALPCAPTNRTRLYVLR